jgi:Xaa-Pro dipeptidase
MTLAFTPKMFKVRQSRLSGSLRQADLPLLALNPGPSLVYLTGLQFHLMERPTVALLAPEAPITLILPELESAKIKSLGYPVQVFTYNDNPVSWPTAFEQAARATRMATLSRCGVEPGRLRVLELRYLEKVAPGMSFVSAAEVLATLRVRKDAEEIAFMRKAVEIAQTGLQATLPFIRAGMTERQIAAELVVQMLRADADTELPFAPIVSSGPNSANPHAAPSDRALQRGDLLVIDWGASYQGYFSDLTRTFSVGEPSPELAHIHKLVLEANAAGRAAAGPGIPAGAVDAAARAVIDGGDFGQYFTHRTGHGLGMEAHEEPYMFGGNPLLLEPGMTFTVEPGIYLPGRNGVRIEDNVVITETGAECLSDMARELRVVG